MAKTVSLREASQKFAQLVREVEERREPVIVTRRGQPVVEIVPAWQAAPAGARTAARAR